MSRHRILAFVAAIALAPLTATADWPTYHADLSRSGFDASAKPGGSIVMSWTRSGLDAGVFAEPLLVGSTLLVATENNTLYALDDSSGAVLWFNHLATPVPNTNPPIPCGNVDPIGITGTPVVDVSAGVLYAVGLTWTPSQASTIHYVLFALDLNNRGATLWTETVPASGTANFDPTIQGQRSALALNGGTVYIPFGGRAGDCGAYHGWMVGAAVTRSAPGAISTFVLATPNGTDTAGGFWASGGSAVDTSGNVYITSGNTFCSGTCASFNYGESVLKLSSTLSLLDYFAPSNYAALNGSDTDLGSVGPALLNGGLLFQVGKEGVGYLLSTTSLGGTNHNTARFSGNVCNVSSDASFGGTAYDATAGRLYVPCVNRIEALDVNTGATPSFVAAWHGPSVSFAGPPIVAGGLVWTIDPAGTLYALDAATGATTFSAGIGTAEHFASPTSGDGHIFVAAGSQVEAFSMGWSGWAPLGGILGSGPDASSWGPNRVDVFIQGQDHQLWHRLFNGTSWSPWEPLGGIITADPSAVSWGVNRIDVFGRGQDKQLWHRFYDGTSWSPWEPLGGILAGSPDAASWGSGRLDVFIRGQDNQLWQRSFSNGAWAPWQPLGGIITASPGAVSWAANRIDVVARGQDNQLWHRWFDGTSWSGWEPGGGVLNGGPDVSSWGPNRLDVFAQGQDHQLWHRSFSVSGWTGWQPLGGILTADPGAVSPALNKIDVFIRGADNQLWERAFN